MKKQWFMFWAILAAAGIITLLARFVLLGVILSCIIYCAFIIWWTLYFSLLKVEKITGALHITSGILFRRTKVIPLPRISWTMRLTVPFHAAAVLTIIHTDAGVSVIFADFSTVS